MNSHRSLARPARRSRGLATLDYCVALAVLGVIAAMTTDSADHLRLALAYVQHWLA